MTRNRSLRCLTVWMTAAGLIGSLAAVTRAQSFDFEKLRQRVSEYSVCVKIQVEFSFGTQTNEHEERLLGTIVSDDGLVVFDGGFLVEESPFVPTGGFSFRSTPRRITVITLDEREYVAEYVGVDRFTGFAFARITCADCKFSPVRFVKVSEFKVGSWLACFALLPEFVAPPLAADIGMISSAVTAPESFPLTVGFNSMEFASVLFDERLNAVGLLGALNDPARRDGQPGDIMESYDQMEVPLLGVITADRLDPLIADPPRRGQAARSWLGITMQSLTSDIADFLGLASPGGIVVNEVIPGSPAEAAGLTVGDVIYGVNGQRVDVDREEELSVFQRQVTNMGVGTSVELGVIRPVGDGLDTLNLLAVLTAAPLAASDAEDFEYEPFEFTVRDLVFSDFIGFNVEQNSLNGVVVAELKPGGLAAISGLYPGDVIQRINDRNVISVEEFTEKMATVEAQRPSEVVFFVWRFGQTMFVNLRTDWP